MVVAIAFGGEYYYKNERDTWILLLIAFGKYYYKNKTGLWVVPSVQHKSHGRLIHFYLSYGIEGDLIIQNILSFNLHIDIESKLTLIIYKRYVIIATFLSNHSPILDVTCLKVLPILSIWPYFDEWLQLFIIVKHTNCLLTMKK